MEEVKPINWMPFRAEFPNLFRGAELSEMDVGEGWTELLWDLCANLEVIAARRVDSGLRPFRIVQVKEKFGGLRFYVRGRTTVKVGHLIQDACAKSECLCEACGEPGSRCLIDNWIKTLCAAHQAVFDARSSHGGGWSLEGPTTG